MKVEVTVDGRRYQVEIGDLNARPVLAIVDGQTISVWPSGSQPAAASAAVAASIEPAPSNPPTTEPTPPRQEPAASNGRGQQDVYAPLPGVVISVAVQAGARVERGEELCVIEAMKMKNAIRSPRDGVVAAVRVSAGQAIQQRDLLIEFAPD